MRIPSLRLLGALLALSASGVVLADEGMWTFDKPPLELLKSRHGFEPSEGWLEHVQRSAVRFSTGGSGSVVSDQGLVMTNHHVGSDILEKLSTAERNLIETGFYARTREEELRCPELVLVALQTIEDVTKRVNAAAEGLDTAEGGAARRKEMTRLEEQAAAETGLHYETVTLFRGGRYHLYGYERYTDVRLVMAPEGQVAFFGGDVANFEYPRTCLDMTFFRIYVDDQPLEPEHYLSWSAGGVSEGDLIFVAGHPGRTDRLNTVAHLEYLRDVRYPEVLRLLWRAEVKLDNYAARGQEKAREAHGDLFGIRNARKAYTGMLAGLHDPELFARKVEAEKALRAAVDADPKMKAEWGDAWGQIASAEAIAGENYRRYLGMGGSRLNLGADLAGIAVHLVRMAEEGAKPNDERLREYTDSQLDSLLGRVLSPAPVYPDLEIERLTNALSLAAELLGGDDPFVARALAGQSPRRRAAALIEGTTLGDIDARQALVDGGAQAIAASRDPLIALVRDLDPSARKLRKLWEDEVEGVEREAYAKVAAAKFAVEGDSVYPDATFTLRLAFGTVKGYRENNLDVAPFTTFDTLYEKSEAHGAAEPYDLPQRWLDAQSKVEIETPYNFVSTPDIVGGNSGSPVIDRAGEVVGLIFDGNIHSLVYSIAYEDLQARSVSVDARAIVESLRKVFDAEELADELTRRGP